MIARKCIQPDSFITRYEFLNKLRRWHFRDWIDVTLKLFKAIYGNFFRQAYSSRLTSDLATNRVIKYVFLLSWQTESHWVYSLARFYHLRCSADHLFFKFKMLHFSFSFSFTRSACLLACCLPLVGKSFKVNSNVDSVTDKHGLK